MGHTTPTMAPHRNDSSNNPAESNDQSFHYPLQLQEAEITTEQQSAVASNRIPSSSPISSPLPPSYSDSSYAAAAGYAHPNNNPQTTGNHALSNSSTPLFTLINLPNRLVFDNVYLNGLHSLYRFGIKNISQSDIVVKMRSSLGSQISFQLTNENLPFDPDTIDSTLQTISTNTAAAAEAGSLTATGHQFNQLFNHVNLIDEVAIAAGETEYIILGFLPDPRGGNRRGKWDSNSISLDTANVGSGNGSTHGDGVQIYDENRQRDMSANGLVNGSNIESDEFESNDQQLDNFDSFEVNGLVFFFGYKTASKSEDSGSTITDITLSNSPPSIHGFPSDLLSTVMVTPGTTNQNTIGPSHEASLNSTNIAMNPITTAITTNKADYQHTVKFRSTVCKSVLYSNIGETGIIFEDCVAHQESVKDFTIWNRSEIPLYWQLNVVDVGSTSRESWLKFVDYEDSFGGNDIKEGVDHVNDHGQVHHSRTIRSKPIQSYGYRRIRVIFRPVENGDFLYDLLLENLNDATNIEEASIHATVRAVSRGEDTLTISTGNTMDFGDCCAGVWSRLPITFSNTGLTPMEVHLNVEGAEVVFDIQTETGTEISEPSQDLTKEGNFLLESDLPSATWHENPRRLESSANMDHLEQSTSPLNVSRSRLRDWMEDRAYSPSSLGQTPISPSLADSGGTKGDRSGREQGLVPDTAPASPVNSEGFFPDNILQINSNVEKYLANQEHARASREGTEDGLESEPENSSIQDSTNSSNALVGQKKRLSLRSISFSGAQRDRELAQSQMHGPKSPVHGNQSMTRIEELFLKPGKERTVIASYRPARDSSIENFQAGKLLRKSFRIMVSYAPWVGTASSVPFSENPQKDRKIIQCKARACTSFVTIEPKSLDFGDTDVGALKSLPIKLINQSEISATVRLDFQSKVLNCSPSGAITIPAKSSTELKLDIYPRKVNPDYRKQLTLFNLTNRANDQIIEVRSTNIDKNRVTFHSLFYRVLYPSGSNFLDFGNVVVGGISLRTIAISNFTRKWLTLEITTSLGGELTVYERARDAHGHININDLNGMLTNSFDSQPKTENGAPTTDPTIISSRGAASSRIEASGVGNVANDGPRTNLFKRRQDTRDQHSATGSESGTSGVIGGASLASTLALKAKAILFHGDVSQTMGTSPAKFLDLATSRPRESKKILRRIPTMKELLEPTSRSKSLSAERSIKGMGGSVTESNRTQRIHASLHQTSGTTASDGTSKRQDGSTVLSQRQHDQKTPQNDGSGQASVTTEQPESSFLSERSLDSVLSAMDINSAPGGAMLFFKPSEEEHFVKERMKLTHELQNAITTGELTPVSVVSVPPETEHQLIILFTPSSTFRDHIKGIPKKQDARIFLRLIDFDHETVASHPQFRPLLDSDLTQIPLREIVVRSSLVRSIMELGQNNINFGTMDKGDRRTKTIVIQNRSKEPLLYHIRKSGSIASGDIHLINGKSGVVRGYSKKEVEFMFEPTLSGPFHEKLAIENVQDPDSSRVLSVKANIRKPKHFSIDTQELDFGVCYVGRKTESRRITVTNSTKQTRTFEVRVDPHEMMPLSTESHHYGGEIDFTMEDDPLGQAIVTKEMEDEIEILEQKLKIAKRKGREDKVLKVTARLSLLRKGGVEDKAATSNISADDATPTQEKVFELPKTDLIDSPIADSQSKGAGAHTVGSSTTVIAPAAKETPKFKRTDHSIVFTLDGGKTKSVSVYFTAVRDQTPLPVGTTEKDRLRLQGKIYVHEHKNRDICRDVAFYATVECKTPVCLDNEIDQDAADVKAAKKAAKKAIKHGADGVDASARLDAISPEMKAPSNNAATSDTSSEHSSPTEHLMLSPKQFDGGKIEHGQKSSFYFTLSNSSDDCLPFKIELIQPPSHSSRFIFEESELSGSLGSKEVRRITFEYSASDLGRLHDSLKVINLNTNKSYEYVFTCFSHRAQYLAFPSVDDSATLDLGHCYVDTGRKYSQVTPLLVENITDDDIYIACASNLSQQVGIYLDEQAEKGQVTKTLLKKRSMITVWVAVQPNLLGGIAGGSTARRTTTVSGAVNKDRDSECRTLVGGIKFTISLPEEILVSAASNSKEMEETLTQVFTQTVKFTSIIGRSILSVSDTLLNLGWTPEVGKPVYGSFTLQNMSSLLPLDFHVESLSGNIILDRTGGILDGWDIDKISPSHHSRSDKRLSDDYNKDYGDQDSTEVAPTDRSRLLISFRVTASAPGLFMDTILVTNENNCSQKIEIKVRLFVDPRQLLTSAHGQGYACPMTLEDLSEIQEVKPGVPREGLSLPSFTWENVYVNVHEERNSDGGEAPVYVSFQPSSDDPQAHIEEKWIEFINDSDETMELVPLSDIGLDTLWQDVDINSGLETWPIGESEAVGIDGFHFCGSVVRVPPKEKIHLLISCPLPDLPSNDIERLQNGENVSLSGNLMVMDRGKKKVVKVLGLTSNVGISYGTVTPVMIELGKIGHYNSWERAKGRFEVRNSSDIPLQYEVLLEPYMELSLAESGDNSRGTESAHNLATRRTVHGHGIEYFEVLLDPKRIENFEIGRRTFPIKIFNLRNPENDMSVSVAAVLTGFELGFDRLMDGKLVLPPLMHPLPSTALPCDAWFTITNKSSEDVRFEIGATLSQDVIDYVHLDVLSRFSNSPLRGIISLSPRGSIEVRIRAFPKEGSRLPSDTSALCTTEGLTFGNLWVSTKPSNTDDDSTSMRYAESISIRGTLVEGSMFSLSTQRIVFKSLLETSDYEGESDDENLSAPDSSHNASSRDISDDGSGPSAQKATITISNLSMNFPLEFQVALEGPMEYPAAEIIKVTPLDFNNRGTIEAGQQFKLVVELIDPHVIISEDIKLYVRNLNSRLGQQQRVLISISSDSREHRKPNKRQIIEDERVDPHHHQNKLEETFVTNTSVSGSLLMQPQASTDLESSLLHPIISLRGCKRIDSSDSQGGRYELDLGQQDMGSTNVLRKIILENTNFDRVSYRIRTISSLDKNWLKISRLDGTLEPPSEEHLSSGSSSVHTITLSFATNVRNVFSTYLLIENVDNPGDTKTVRVTMEVVARQNLRRTTKGNEVSNRVFDVYVNGIDYKNSSSIDMKNLYYGSEYTARSLVVYNRETVPMEFTFKSNLSPSDSTEILFSTSRTSAKLFKTLTVPSENHVRIYIRFFPKPSTAIQAALDNGEYRDPDEMELKTIEIYINCRLVKDYQHVVILTAECYLPAIRVHWQDSVSFVGHFIRETAQSSDSPDELKLRITEDYMILGISNLLGIPLEYEIVNDTMYFNLEYPEPDKMVDGFHKHEIRVVPNMKALLRNAENFRKERYVQENITIYNRNRPLENYWIPLRISFGNVSNFQLSSGYKSSYAFGMIEQHVVNFLSDFNSHAVLVTMGSSNGCFTGVNSTSNVGSGPNIGFGGASGLYPASIGLGPDRGISPSSLGSNSPCHSSSPTLLMNGGSGLTTLMATSPSSGPVAGMLGLGRRASPLTTYRPPSHHPHYQSTEAQETQRKLIDLEFQYRYVVDQLVYYSTIKTGENFFQLASLLFCTLLSNRIFQIWSPAYLKDPRKAGSSTGTGTTGPAVGSANLAVSGTVGSVTADYDGNVERAQVQTGANGFTIQGGHHRQQDETEIRVWPDSLRKWVEALDYFVSFFPYHARQLETLKALHHSLISS
ncbi:hypothetical protein BCR41DRAFT_382971 [Lobosporangium transversale]|uniref:Uncharacterized protein n=1 Tax=Lobosporangium transversale TaxID=64571 RepID=A0A1Y2H3I1_9FUNG|nr:hypothetical protein BCR41DRAFT_382971 [Lobosporangium transversale]ORZ29119.1 hypothetical protein BCR41DRAFT_382971 [Lobosporangium transversale]|eukprot:XP_021886792.1 hypothetical protein BCR41DRAFT_382971 [Lobosporangium transversale]